ncbi:MAG: cytochrome-c oxidase, cbb3-type subunit III [Gammaproteobacteria bacterium]
MPDLSGLDFTSGFWRWFVTIPTVVGILWMAWFAYRYSRGVTVKPGTKVETMGHVWDGDLAEYNNPLPGWWLNLFYLTLAWGAVFLVFYPGLPVFEGLKKWSQYKQYDAEITAANEKYSPLFDKYKTLDIPTTVKDPNAISIGQRLFSTYCTQCHGSDARGAKGFPNLTDGDWIWGGNPEQIETTILDGRQAAMPAWGSLLDANKINDVAEYVLSLSGRPVDAAVAARGHEVFTQNCAVCHGADGKGNQQMGSANLTDDIWLYGGSQQRVRETITGGRQGHMPAHREFLGEAKVHLLAAYVYSLSHPSDSNTSTK